MRKINNCYHWDSNEEFNQQIRTLEDKWFYSGYDKAAKSDWTNNLNFDQSLKRSIYGDEATVKLAEEYIEKLDDLGVESPHTQWLESVAGAYPVVPEYLAGHPMCMRAPLTNLSERGPLRVYVNICASAGFTKDQLMKRGAAILAFVLKVQQTRPVDLLVCGDFGTGKYVEPVGDDDIQFVIPLESRPINLSQAAYVLGDCSYIRHLWWPMAYSKGVGPSIPWGRLKAEPGSRDYPKYESLIKQRLGGTDSDLYVPMAYLDDELVKRPLEWIKRTIDKLQLTDTEI